MKKFSKFFVFKKKRLIAFGKKLLILIASLFVLFFFLNLLFPLPDKVSYSVIVRDANGEVVNAYLTPDDKWRMKTEVKTLQIPLYFKKSFGWLTN